MARLAVASCNFSSVVSRANFQQSLPVLPQLKKDTDWSCNNNDTNRANRKRFKLALRDMIAIPFQCKVTHFTRNLTKCQESDQFLVLKLFPFSRTFSDLSFMFRAGSMITIASSDNRLIDFCKSIFFQMQDKIMTTSYSPVLTTKAVKDETEQRILREAHVRRLHTRGCATP